MTRITHISSAPFTGGAARAGYRLHQGLLAGGVDSVWLDASGTAPSAPDIRRLDVPKKARGFSARWRRWTGRDFSKRLRRAFAGTDTYHSWPEGWGRSGHLPGPAAGGDIWNLHWTAGFMHWGELLPALARRAPVVWTLHDLSPLRGVWHYEPFADEHGAERDGWDRRAAALKGDALASLPEGRLVFVAPSRWIADQCRRSPMTSRFEVRHIPYGLPETAYRPVAKYVAREALGLSAEGVLLGFVADSIGDRRKGIKELEAALGRLPGSASVRLLTAGSGAPAEAGPERIHLGPLRDDRLMRLFYSACDVFVCPSLQDNLPNTVLEAMACGTPVAGFALGGLPDMIIPGETGWLAEAGDVAGLAAVLEGAAADRARLARMGENARGRVDREYPLGLQARRYRELYDRLLGV